MSFLTEYQLRQKAQRATTYKSRILLETKEEKARLTIFLSHSHKDRDLVLGLIALLADSNIRLYVDWQDDSMPRVTNRDTAEKIKARINELDLFWILATRNALLSRWVPWEIGVADTRKTANLIAIIPVADPSGQFQGNEYLQLYQQISLSTQSELAVFPPHKSRGQYLETWLRYQVLEKMAQVR